MKGQKSLFSVFWGIWSPAPAPIRQLQTHLLGTFNFLLSLSTYAWDLFSQEHGDQPRSLNKLDSQQSAWDLWLLWPLPLWMMQLTKMKLGGLYW